MLTLKFSPFLTHSYSSTVVFSQALLLRSVSCYRPHHSYGPRHGVATGSLLLLSRPLPIGSSAALASSHVCRSSTWFESAVVRSPDGTRRV